MSDRYESREYKDERVAELLACDVDSLRLGDIDARLEFYVRDVRGNGEVHNLYEVLAVLKFVRLMREYVFRKDKFLKFVRLYEGLKFSGMNGRKSYKLTPIQVFQFASILGFYRWEDSGVEEEFREEKGEKKSKENKGERGSKEDGGARCGVWDGLETVRVDADGRRWELRRLVREAILFVPRKFSKTTSSASLAVNEVLFGDANAQAYTAANSYKQARICFEEISKIVQQLDPKKKYFKATRESLKWRPNKYGKESFVECLSGGGDTKDGLNASLVIFDEYAQAKYVKDHSDGAELLQVLTSSMGTRREPLTVIITTASRVEDSPFTIELENAKRVLLREYVNDSQFASLFMPDAWEMDEDGYGNPMVWKKCNPHIGVTIQQSYYRDRWAKAQHDAEAMIEFKTKLLNVFTSGGIKDWVSASLARSLQAEFSLDNVQERPPAMVALDLSVSDDFSAVVYNIYSRAQRKFYLFPEFYIPKKTIETHPNGMLYQGWAAAGWLKVCEGAVIDDRMIVNDILKNNEKVKILQIGYDSYKSQEVVNSLSAAIAGRGGNPDKIMKAVPQTYGAFTSPVETFEMAAKRNPPQVAMNMNPILPYCFGNCYLDEDKMCNKKPIKRKENMKIDGVIASLMTFWMYNNYEGL